jgi:hypothetical protein
MLLKLLLVGWLDFECTWALTKKMESSEHNYQRDLTGNFNRIYSSYKLHRSNMGYNRFTGQLRKYFGVQQLPQLEDWSPTVNMTVSGTIFHT